MHGLIWDPLDITIEDERLGLRAIGRLRIEMDRLERAGQTALVISEKNIIGSTRANLRRVRLYPLIDERLMRFAPAFDGRRLKIGLCIRRYDDLWTSGLMYAMTRGASVPSDDDLDMMTTQPRRWRHVIRDIARAFPNADLFVWPFERMADRPDDQLRAMLGTRRALPKSKSEWNNRSADILETNEMPALRGLRPLTIGSVATDARWMPFNEDQRAVLLAEYHRDLTWLRAGGEGLVTFIETENDTEFSKIDGPKTPAARLDRADTTRTADVQPVLFGGRYDRIKESPRDSGLGRTGAS
jgi:hypothetical protein